MFLMVKKKQPQNTNKNNTHKKRIVSVLLPNIHMTWLSQFLTNNLVCSSENDKFEQLLWVTSLFQPDKNPIDF